MKRILATVIAIVLVLFGIVLVVNNAGEVNAPTKEEESLNQNNQQTPEQVKEFTITAKPFSFTPSSISVNQGDKVRIVLKNEQGTHDWNLEEYGVATKVLNAGQSDTVEFIATDKGEFEYFCSVANHRQMGMVGKLTVN